NKVPKIKRWQRGGLKTDKSIYELFGKYDSDVDYLEDLVQIGVPTGFPLQSGGYLVVLDVDSRNGGEEALAKLTDLPETVTAETTDGLHYWFWSATPFPSFTRPDSLEIKCVGSYVVVPPAPGRLWVRDPFSYPIAQVPEWLKARPAQPKPAGTRTYMLTCPATGQSSILDLGPKGQRHTRLLKLAGSYNHRGKTSDSDRAALTQAALRSGLPLSEADRLIGYCFNSTPKASTCSPEAGAMLIKGVVTKNDEKVLKAALGHFQGLCLRRHLKDKWEGIANAWKDVLACRFIGDRIGLDAMSVSRSLRSLVSAGMLWRSPKLRRLPKGWAYQYRPTYLGVAYAAQKLGFDPEAKPQFPAPAAEIVEVVNMEVCNERAA